MSWPLTVVADRPLTVTLVAAASPAPATRMTSITGDWSALLIVTTDPRIRAWMLNVSAPLPPVAIRLPASVRAKVWLTLSSLFPLAKTTVVSVPEPFTPRSAMLTRSPPPLALIVSGMAPGDWTTRMVSAETRR